jgi:Xaa-Pro aminopeptidase
MRMLANGAHGFAFEPLVLAAGNAANPHGVPGDRPLRPGDALLIDFGASFDGYNADITRTFFCQHVSDEHARIYETVLAANGHGRAIAGPDLTAHDLDMAVTGVLAASPFAGLIVHKTGHGLGMDVHEAPQIMRGNHKPLVPGTVFTIEPGLYRPGDVGVRIEDNVVTLPGGARSLTGFGRDLTLVGI